MSTEPEGAAAPGPLHPPFGYQDIVSEGWTCTTCAVTIARSAVLTELHQSWHRDLNDRLEQLREAAPSPDST